MSTPVLKEEKSTSNKPKENLALGSIADDNRLVAQRRATIQMKVVDTAQREENDDFDVISENDVEESAKNSIKGDQDVEATSENDLDENIEAETDPKALENGQKQTATVLKSVMEDTKTASEKTQENVDDTPGWGARIWQGVKVGSKKLADMALRFIPGVGAIYGLIKDIKQARKRHSNWEAYSSVNAEIEADNSGVVSIFKEKISFAMSKARRGFIDAMYAVVSSVISAFTSIADFVSAGIAKVFTTPISIAKGVITALKTLIQHFRGGWKWFSGTLHKDRKEAVRLLVESAAGVGEHANEKDKALEILARVNPEFTEEWAKQALEGGNHHFEEATMPLYNTMDSKAGE